MTNPLNKISSFYLIKLKTSWKCPSCPKTSVFTKRFTLTRDIDRFKLIFSSCFVGENWKLKTCRQNITSCKTSFWIVFWWFSQKCYFSWPKQGLQMPTLKSFRLSLVSRSPLLSEYIEWQWPLSSVHFIMMEKISLGSSGGGGCTLTPLHYKYHHIQNCGVRSIWEGRYTPPISTLLLFVLFESTDRFLSLVGHH